MARVSLCLVASLAIWLTGCINLRQPPTGAFTRPEGLFPSNAQFTQRAILTALGKQYTFNGILAVNEAGEMRLIMMQMFGNVVADVLVKGDGTVHVLRSSRMLRPKWLERYVAADMKCIFGKSSPDQCPVRMVDKDHFVIERRWYTVDLRNVETKPGLQPARLFDETRAN
jgi:hypothetical protein